MADLDALLPSNSSVLSSKAEIVRLHTRDRHVLCLWSLPMPMKISRSQGSICSMEGSCDRPRNFWHICRSELTILRISRPASFLRRDACPNTNSCGRGDTGRLTDRWEFLTQRCGSYSVIRHHRPSDNTDIQRIDISALMFIQVAVGLWI